MAAAEFDGAPTAGTVRRRRSASWKSGVSALERSARSLKRTDSYEVESILMKIGGWESIQGLKSGKPVFPLYGPQKTFVRCKEQPD